MAKSVVISQQANHGHPCSNPFSLSAILGKNKVRQTLGNLRKASACL